LTNIASSCIGLRIQNRALEATVFKFLAAAGALALTGAISMTANAVETRSSAYVTTELYVEQFYPLWFTYYQYQGDAAHNRLAGPDKISPIYQIVVAINVDTLYASAFLDLTAQPIVLSIPPTTATYSILVLDSYGDIFNVGLNAGTPGTFILVGPGYAGPLPTGATRIKLPFNIMSLIFRIDNYSSIGVNQMAEATSFRAALATQPLCAYQNLTCPTGTSPGGPALIIPETHFAVPFKTVADTLVANDPITFLKQLQTAVMSPNTPPKSLYQQGLSTEFNLLFGTGTTYPSDFAAATQAAYQKIIQNYTFNLDRNNWIHFTNIGNWGDNALDRSSITEFIQYGNNIGAAAYYQAFRDINGLALDGSNPNGYVLTFSKNQIPQATRFWSLTAYTPNSIELISNSADKYAVASYTPGLQYNKDGSLTVYMSQNQPAGVPMANWLPISNGPFNVMLRAYGVPADGNIANDTYVPPGIVKNNGRQ
jgi:hypothetical protein